MQVRGLEDQFRRVIENARDIIVLFDTAGNRLYTNPPGLAFFEDQYPRGRDADPFQHVHPEDRERVRAEYTKIASGGEPRRFELRAVTRDGKPWLMQVEATPVRDASGGVLAVLAISRNVTEERRDEAALKATLATLFEQAPIGISVTDPEGHFLTINQRMRDILGFGDGDVSKYNVWDVAYGPDKARTDAERDNLLSGRIERFEMEKRILRPNGDIRWVSCSAGMVRPPLGGENLVVEFAVDITERMGVDEALRDREELLEAIFDHAPIGISITDSDARYVRANPRFLSMLGYTEKELYRLTGWDLLPANEVEENRRRRDELFAGKREEYSWERRYIRKDGDILWVQNTVALIRDAAGAPRYAVALIEDISERKLSDAAMRVNTERQHALTRRLVELQEAERRDIARELHDRVGQTLTAMRINMDLVRARLAQHDDPVIRTRNDDSIELIESAFKAVENLMYDLRPPMLDEYGLVAPLKWYAEQFAGRTGIRVQVRGDESRRCPPGIELALFRIAQEALNNVARHSLARNVAIEFQAVGPHIILTIKDDGVGFDFEAGRTERAGYGLITMRERAEAVGGTFDAHSVKGKGTRIRVEVPSPP